MNVKNKYLSLFIWYGQKLLFFINGSTCNSQLLLLSFGQFNQMRTLTLSCFDIPYSNKVIRVNSVNQLLLWQKDDRDQSGNLGHKYIIRKWKLLRWYFVLSDVLQRVLEFSDDYIFWIFRVDFFNTCSWASIAKFLNIKLWDFWIFFFCQKLDLFFNNISCKSFCLKCFKFYCFVYFHFPYPHINASCEKNACSTVKACRTQTSCLLHLILNCLNNF